VGAALADRRDLEGSEAPIRALFSSPGAFSETLGPSFELAPLCWKALPSDLVFYLICSPATPIGKGMVDVSVVIPTHNRRALLQTTLKSVLWQRGVTLEAVVVDDGSTDDTAGFIEGLEDSRVRLIRNEAARGVSQARNRGIEVSCGAWIAFLDDDDLWAPDKLRLQLDAAAASGRSWVYSGVVKVDAHLNIIGGTTPPTPDWVIANLKRWNQIPGGCSNVLVAEPLLSSVGGFDPGFDNLADWDMWIRLGEKGPPASLADPLVAYRFHPANLSLDLGKLRRELGLLQGRYGLSLDWGAIHYYMARLAQRSGRKREAAMEYLKAAGGGEWAAVARELAWLVRRRLNVPPKKQGPGASNREWSAGARSWLEELRSGTAWPRVSVSMPPPAASFRPRPQTGRAKRASAMGSKQE
jgi:glycosyltransferase involved in cell wall biosynthesis